VEAEVFHELLHIRRPTEYWKEDFLPATSKNGSDEIKSN
jgi:hypothetical protein